MGGRPKKTADEVEFGKRFGEALKRFREKHKDTSGRRRSQRSFAEYIGASPEAYQKWEQRGAMPVYGLSLILQKTRVTAESLIFGADTPTAVGLSDQAIRFAEQFDQLPPNERDELERMFHVFQELEKTKDPVEET